MVVNKNILDKVNGARLRLLHRFSCPGICYLCSNALKQDDFLICWPCKNDLPLNVPACPACALPVPANKTLCGACIRTSSQSFGNVFALFGYLFPVNRLIHGLKFHGRIEIAAFIGSCMARFAVAQGLELLQCFIPVPLHNSRVAERGYNQSLEIARSLGALLNVPVYHGVCGRVLNTPPQSTVSAALRESNIKGAFAISGPCVSMPKHVALVDDVITTGATVKELARVLGCNGVARVDVWASARTIY